MNEDRRRGRDTLTNEDATYGWRKSFRYVAKRQNGVQTAGANPARSIKTNTSGNRVAAKRLGVEIQVTGDFGSPLCYRVGYGQDL